MIEDDFSDTPFARVFQKLCKIVDLPHGPKRRALLRELAESPDVVVLADMVNLAKEVAAERKKGAQ
ncbi:hypothetical protein [Defluviimonas salinarum]|uniref:Uncharacterized protein n=1 Tax=Defluviimonas salinarum TaxID=2992147 RepID=A0ABT3IXW5_9RHOB|nr:hypothetical protein [Defluviimonas salinarum]MCW3780278.1 hypothetical protein [Defluviimonas salinarum]